ncbi:MAG: FAD-binding oxidoreductase [Oscillospiraceae bacterium]|nr:FAD-binding oxidoreductase [Oscillospiraceae bacterium]
MDLKLIRPMTEEFAEYLRDESRSVGSAEHIAFPRTQDEIREILKACYASGEKVTVQGARTGLAAAAVPYGGCIVNLNKMNRVTAMRHEGGDYYITLQPGVVLSELKKMIGSKKFDTTDWDEASNAAYVDFCKDGEFFFSPDPTEASATIGGMVCCNASGARSYHYGPTRGHITKVTMVLSDGRTLTETRGGECANGYDAVFTCDDGSKISAKLPTYEMPKTKNASGYYAAKDMELIDVLIGSDGTLGVVSEIEVKLLPLPQIIWGVSLLFENEQSSLRFVDQLRGSVEGVASVEFFDSGALDILREQKKKSTAFSALPVIEPFVNTVVYVELHCDTEEQAQQRLFAVGDAFTAAGGKEENSWVARNQSDLDRLMFFRHAVPESVNMLIDQRKQKDPTITKLGADMSVPDAHLFDVVKMYRDTLKENNLESATWGHVGNNHLHVNVLPNNGEEYARAKELFKVWAANVSKMGGAVSAEHGVGKLKAAFLTIMYGDRHIDEMRALKRAFDPKWQLGVGNLFTEKEGI